MKGRATRLGAKRGLAALEFVMVLPILVALLVLIFFVGHAGTDQLSLSNELHFQTWRGRVDSQPSDVAPCCFDEKDKVGKLEDRDQGVVKSGTIYDKWNHGTKSTATAYANSWSAASKARGYDSGWSYRAGATGNAANEQVVFCQRDGKLTLANSPKMAPEVSATPVRNNDYVSKRK